MGAREPGRNSVDVLVGDNVRLQRMRLGLGPSFLANRLGISLVEFQDCELGLRRFGAERLLELARLMDASPRCFFEVQSVDRGEILH
jgi:hypothetical protein